MSRVHPFTCSLLKVLIALHGRSIISCRKTNLELLETNGSSDSCVDETTSLADLTLNALNVSTSLEGMTGTTSKSSRVVLPPKFWRRFLKDGVILGEGSFGMVEQYNLEDQCGVDAKKVAVKRNKANPTSLQLLLKEIKIMKLLQANTDVQAIGGHPNIIRMYDYFPRPRANQESRTSMMLEFADMGTIYEAVKVYLSGFKWLGQRQRALRHERKFRLVTTMALDLIRGLVFMHKVGIIHRDIKPDNIFASEGKFLLADLGLAVLKDDILLNAVDKQKKGGTEAYQPPEVQKGASFDAAFLGMTSQKHVADDGKYLSFWSIQGDVWALGQVLMAVLKGCNPRPGKIRIFETGNLKPSSCNKLPYPPDVPASLMLLITDMTRENYTERPVGEDLMRRAEDVYKELHEVDVVPDLVVTAVPECVSQCAALECLSECIPQAGQPTATCSDSPEVEKATEEEAAKALAADEGAREAAKETSEAAFAVEDENGLDPEKALQSAAEGADVEAAESARKTPPEVAEIGADTAETALKDLGPSASDVNEVEAHDIDIAEPEKAQQIVAEGAGEAAKTGDASTVAEHTAAQQLDTKGAGVTAEGDDAATDAELEAAQQLSAEAAGDTAKAGDSATGAEAVDAQQSAAEGSVPEPAAVVSSTGNQVEKAAEEEKAKALAAGEAAAEPSGASFEVSEKHGLDPEKALQLTAEGADVEAAESAGKTPSEMAETVEEDAAQTAAEDPGASVSDVAEVNEHDFDTSEPEKAQQIGAEGGGDIAEAGDTAMVAEHKAAQKLAAEGAADTAQAGDAAAVAEAEKAQQVAAEATADTPEAPEKLAAASRSIEGKVQ
eukprot:TRINITY_DN7123_c0_g1_i1.p1 TRINITY_DN7123_c0_g1~~TRINITY_DN7123_c0_g1_i1.p1  ORF type:complete len:839 (+),score=152.61 TRINITY_DN7123_c0_g1_i1:56-2572(+)